MEEEDAIAYPEAFNKEQKRNLRKRAEKFQLENAVVYYVGPDGKEQP